MTVESKMAAMRSVVQHTAPCGGGPCIAHGQLISHLFFFLDDW